jgi:hypothetical protein
MIHLPVKIRGAQSQETLDFVRHKKQYVPKKGNPKCFNALYKTPIRHLKAEENVMRSQEMLGSSEATATNQLLSEHYLRRQEVKNPVSKSLYRQNRNTGLLNESGGHLETDKNSAYSYGLPQ